MTHFSPPYPYNFPRQITTFKSLLRSFLYYMNKILGQLIFVIWRPCFVVAEISFSPLRTLWILRTARIIFGLLWVSLQFCTILNCRNQDPTVKKYFLRAVSEKKSKINNFTSHFAHIIHRYSMFFFGMQHYMTAWLKK